jgi:hypothetical protein
MLVTSTATLSTASVVVGVLEARLPLGPGNTAVHHGYPFFAVGMALTLTAVGGRAATRAARWSLLVTGIGAAYAANALLIALLSLAVTPSGSDLPVGVLGWLADVFFPVCDIGFLGLMVGLLPDVRPRSGHRWAMTVLVGLTASAILGEGLVPHVLDSTTVENPFGVQALAGLAPVAQLLVPVMFVYALLLSLVRGLVLARESRRRGDRVGAAAACSAVALLLTFVGQAAVPESNPWAAGAIMLAGCIVASTFACRVARGMAPRPRRTEPRGGDSP